MKKQIVLLILTIFIFCFYTCDMTIPTAIEVEGTPSFTFTGPYNAGHMLSDMVSGMFDDYREEERIKIFDCVDVKDTYTKLVYVDLITHSFFFENADEILAALEELEGLGQPAELPFDSGNTLLAANDFERLDYPDSSDEEELTMPTLDLKEIIGEFEFNGYKALLYVYGHPIIKVLDINLTCDIPGHLSEKLTLTNVPTVFNNPVPSEEYENEFNYTGLDLPGSGNSWPVNLRPHDVSYLVTENGLEEFHVDFNVLPDSVITKEMVVEEDIKFVLAVWLPFQLIATAEGTYEVFDFGPSKNSIDDDKDLICDTCGQPVKQFCTCFDPEEEPSDLLGRSQSGAMLDGVLEIIDMTLIVSIGSDVPFKHPSVRPKIRITNGKEDDPHHFVKESDLYSRTIALTFDPNQMEKIFNTYPFMPYIDVWYDTGTTVNLPKVLDITRLDMKASIKARVEF